jgi:hypothetical protein
MQNRLNPHLCDHIGMGAHVHTCRRNLAQDVVECFAITAGPAGRRLYSGPTDPRFQELKGILERDWIPQMADLLALSLVDLPVIWDADFLLGPKTAAGSDSYLLCEINASSVFPIPEEAPDAIVGTLLEHLARHGAPRSREAGLVSPVT